jgi:hypothetical protein
MASALIGIPQVYPLSGSRQDLLNLEKFAGGSLSKEYQFLQQLARRNVYWKHDDFDRLLIDSTNQWSLATGNTATAFAVSATPGDDGWIRGAAGATAATSGLQIATTNTFTASKRPGFEIGFQSSVITEARFEVGFVNALPTVNTNIGNNLSTPSFNTSTQVAIWLRDNASSTTTAGKYTKGTSVTAAKTAFTSGLTAATYMCLRGEVSGDGSFFSVWENGQLMSGPGVTALLTTSTAMIFALAHKTNDTTDKNVDIDFITLWKARSN